MPINGISSFQGLRSLPKDNSRICKPKQNNLLINHQNVISFQGSQALKSLALNNITFKSAALDEENKIKDIKAKLESIIEQDKKRERPVFLEVDPQFTAKLAKLIADPKKRITIGITGESAGGKSFFREAIIATPPASKYAFINMDDYYKDINDEIGKYGNKSEFMKATNYNYDVPEAVDLNFMREQLLDLKAGLFACSPKYYYKPSASVPNANMIEPSRVIVADGIFCLTNPEIYKDPRKSKIPNMAELMDIKMYVDASPDEIEKRWRKRAAKRGVTGEAADIQFKTVTDEAKEHIIPTKEFADVVINGEAREESYQEVFGEIFSLVNASQNAK